MISLYKIAIHGKRLSRLLRASIKRNPISVNEAILMK